MADGSKVRAVIVIMSLQTVLRQLRPYPGRPDIREGAPKRGLLKSRIIGGAARSRLFLFRVTHFSAPVCQRTNHTISNYGAIYCGVEVVKNLFGATIRLSHVSIHFL